MIKVFIEKDMNGDICSFTMEGHANYAEKGQDIVCAGASAVAFGSINAIIALTGVKPLIEQSKTGFLHCTFDQQLPHQHAEEVQLLLQAMIVSLQTIENDYADYIKIEGI